MDDRIRIKDESGSISYNPYNMSSSQSSQSGRMVPPFDKNSNAIQKKFYEDSVEDINYDSHNQEVNTSSNPLEFDESGQKARDRQLQTYRTRPVRSCTHCRQQKIKCNAYETYPEKCTRCQKIGRVCEIDPFFKPQKGGQVQILRDEFKILREQVETLQKRENYLESVIAQKDEQARLNGLSNISGSNSPATEAMKTSPISVASITPGLSPEATHQNLVNRRYSSRNSPSVPAYSDQIDSTRFVNPPTVTSSPAAHNADAVGANSPKPFNQKVHNLLNSASSSSISIAGMLTSEGAIDAQASSSNIPLASSHIPEVPGSTLKSNGTFTVFTIGDVTITKEQADNLHSEFMTNYLPHLPIIQSTSASELYTQSRLLFWTVCLTACLSHAEPTLYNSLCSLIKQLAIETCWIHTPRSTHIVQALLILGTWPLPNQKVLDDCSYRFVGLAKGLGMQLGLHRGRFITEFSRTQVCLPDAVKWRSRTWLSVFIMDQVWSASLGLPPTTPIDYLIEEARDDCSLPSNFRALLAISVFISKLVTTVGVCLTTEDGLIESKNRINILTVMEQELERLGKKIDLSEHIVEIFYLGARLMICCFSFLPPVPNEDQAKYIIIAYHTATKIITMISKLASERRLIELPIWVRQMVSLSVLTLFRLHLSPFLLKPYVESARQSIVTVHRLFRNMLTAWKNVDNDISRTAQVLEKLNYVIATHPELFTKAPAIITRMRSHLTASMFYELVWAIHEARRRTDENNQLIATSDNVAQLENKKEKEESDVDSNILPLPFYSRITKDDYTTMVTTTPNGTTITTLVPTGPHSNHGNVVGFNEYNVPISARNQNIPSDLPVATGNREQVAQRAHKRPLEGGSNITDSQGKRTVTTVSNGNTTSSETVNAAQNLSNTGVPISVARLPINNKISQVIGEINLDSSAPGLNTNKEIKGGQPMSMPSDDLDSLIKGIDWVDGQGDDFLGWMDWNLN